MKFKILKYKISEVEDIEVNDEDCEYSVGWLELEVDGNVKMLCFEMVNYLESESEEIEFGYSKEWYVKSRYVDEWIENGSDLENNLYSFFESWDDKLNIDYKDVYSWDDELIGYEYEI